MMPYSNLIQIPLAIAMIFSFNTRIHTRILKFIALLALIFPLIPMIAYYCGLRFLKCGVSVDQLVIDHPLGIFFYLVITLSSILAILAINLGQKKYSPAFFSLYFAFVICMIGVSFTEDVRYFMIYWELMLLFSTILIAIWGDSEQKMKHASRYFMINQASSVFLFTSLILLGSSTAHWQIAEIDVDLFSQPQKILITISFLIAFLTKSAIFPFHFWLPDAHTSAPLPITVLLASAMLPLGLFGVIRFPIALFGFEFFSLFSPFLIFLAIISKIYGAVLAFRENQIKRIVAYSSISQLGLVLFSISSMTEAGIAAALFHILVHALIKGLLFIIANEMIVSQKVKDIRKIQPNWQSMRKIGIITIFASAALIGVPPLPGFSSEVYIFSSSFASGLFWSTGAMIFASILTASYLLRFIQMIFLSNPKHMAKVAIPAEPNLVMKPPAVILVSIIMLFFLMVTAAPVYNWLQMLVQSSLNGI